MLLSNEKQHLVDQIIDMHTLHCNWDNIFIQSNITYWIKFNDLILQKSWFIAHMFLPAKLLAFK